MLSFRRIGLRPAGRRSGLLAEPRHQQGHVLADHAVETRHRLRGPRIDQERRPVILPKVEVPLCQIAGIGGAGRVRIFVRITHN
jgi:hypothetical protein